jgi:hypothetical protein
MSDETSGSSLKVVVNSAGGGPYNFADQTPPPVVGISEASVQALLKFDNLEPDNFLRISQRSRAKPRTKSMR